MSDYITSDELRDYMGSSTTINETLASAACTVVSRQINEYCGRRFYADTSASARTYPVVDLLRLEVDDISTTTGVIVKTDDNLTGTYGTTWTVGTDYILEPVNPAASGTSDPWTSIRATGAQRYFPYVRSIWTLNPYPVQVTATWGWPAVPDAVKQAALIGAAYLFSLKDAPDGFKGLDGWGPRQIRDAPMFKELLGPYRKNAVTVA